MASHKVNASKNKFYIFVLIEGQLQKRFAKRAIFREDIVVFFTNKRKI
jgi:hypothetical protein